MDILLVVGNVTVEQRETALRDMREKGLEPVAVQVATDRDNSHVQDEAERRIGPESMDEDYLPGDRYYDMINQVASEFLRAVLGDEKPADVKACIYVDDNYRALIDQMDSEDLVEYSASDDGGWIVEPNQMKLIKVAEATS